MPIDPLTGVPVPSDAAQGKFGRMTDAVLAGMRNWIETPGRAMQDGITTDQAVNWAAPTAMGMIAGGRLPGAAPEGAVGIGGAKLGQPEGIRAYHGSPHDFDRFSLDKIGTGEGAQAYGHGAYFAENEAVARQYRDTLQGKGFKVPEDVMALPDEQRTAILRAANAHGAQPDPMQAAKRAQWASTELRSQPLESIADQIARSRPPAGKMYEVNINAHPDQFLDWDKPLAQQPGIAKVAAELPNDVVKAWTQNGAFPHVKGQSLYDTLAMRGNASGMAAGNVGGRDAATSMLRDAGIPGIKYLDQGSRGAGDGSRNFVVFNDKIIQILRKYGVSSIAALPPAVQASLGAKDAGGGFGSLIPSGN